MHLRSLFGYKISDTYGPVDKPHPRKFLKRAINRQTYGFKFNLSQSSSSKRLKAPDLRAASISPNEGTSHTRESKFASNAEGSSRVNIAPRQTNEGIQTTAAAVERANVQILDDVSDVDGPSNIVELSKPGSSDSSDDVIGALKGIIHVPKELIEAEEPSLHTSLLEPLSYQEQEQPDVSTPIIPTDSDELPNEVEVSCGDRDTPEIASTSCFQELVIEGAGLPVDATVTTLVSSIQELDAKGGTIRDHGVISAQESAQDLAQQTANLPISGLVSNIPEDQIKGINFPKNGGVSGHASSTQKMYAEDKGGLIDGFVPSSSQQTHTAIDSPVPEAFCLLLERTTWFLISDHLKSLLVKDTIPSVEEFLALSDNISRDLVGLRVPLGVWDNLGGQILTILKQIESVEGLNASEMDSQMSKEEIVLQDLRSLQDALTIRKNNSMAFESTRTKIAQIDAQIKQIEEERSELLSDLQKEEDSLRNTEDAHESNSELIEKSEAQLNSLIERRRFASSIEGQKLALHKIIKEF